MTLDNLDYHASDFCWARFLFFFIFNFFFCLRFFLLTAHYCGSLYRRHYTDNHDNKLLSNFFFNHLLNLYPDLTTYDTVKDNWVTHTISR